MNKKAPNE